MSISILEQPNLSLNQSSQAECWKQPVPLTYILNNEAPYPLEALPNIVQRVVHAYQNYGQQPMFLVASGALANLSLACQALANVARDKVLSQKYF